MNIIYFWLTYGTVSIFLIVLFIILFGKHKQFHFSFYRLVQCDLVLNIFVYTSTWIARLTNQDETKQQLINIFYKFNFLFVLSVFFNFYFFHAQSISTIILCVHRYSLAKFSTANRFWNNHFFKTFISGLIYSCIIMMVMYYIDAVPSKYYNAKANQIDSFVTSKAQYYRIFGMLFGFSAVYFVLIFSIGVMSLWEVKKRFSRALNSTQTKAMTKQMTTIVIVNTCIYLTVIIWQLLGPFFIWDLTQQQKDAILMSVSDVLTLSMPYVLIIFDKNVRFALLHNVKKSTYTTNNSMIDVTGKQPRIVNSLTASKSFT